MTFLVEDDFFICFAEYKSYFIGTFFCIIHSNSPSSNSTLIQIDKCTNRHHDDNKCTIF